MNNGMKPKTKNRITRKEVLQRSIWTFGLICLGFAVCIGSLVNVQLFKGETFKGYAERNQLKDETITAKRGTIYDCNMNVLAQSAQVWKVYINPNNFCNDDIPQRISDQALDKITTDLSKIFQLDKAELTAKIQKNSKNNYLVVKSKVEKTQRDLVQTLREYSIPYKDSEGNSKSVKMSFFVGIENDVKRYYPCGNLASTLLGFTGTDDIGLYGLEYTYNDILTGTDGRRIYANSAMNTKSSVDFETVYDAEEGSGLVLTVDETIQRYLENALDQCYADSGCDNCYGIVMKADTGAILAMSSKNDYDPNHPYEITDERVLSEIDGITEEAERNQKKSDAQTQQWGNNAVHFSYEPGSVFKLITLSAAIEEGKEEEDFYCSGRIHILDTDYNCHNHSGHGSETLNEALANSCNPYFITLGQNLGIEKFNKYFEAFGFTEKTGIDLSGEAAPVEGRTYHKFDNMSKINLASCSFGQSFQVSGIQMITAVNAIANGGKLMKPYVVSKVLDENGSVIEEKQPTVRRQVISESTAKRVLEAMTQTVESGTAKNAYIAGFNIGGKTGTSDKLKAEEKGQVVASFAGIAPANDPEVSIIIIVDNPKGSSTGGGAVAAPVAAEVLENTLTYLNVKKNYTEDEESHMDVAVSNYVGMSLDEAREKADENGLTVKVVGEGDSVTAQCPAFGQFMPQDGVIAFYTDRTSGKSMTTVPDFADMSISEANSAAISAGINIKISGNALRSTGLAAYRQSIPKGTEVEYGSSVTVYFKTGTGITDA